MTLTASPAEQALANADRAFAADLFGRLAATPGGVAVSPYSVASALRMTSYGARGRTAEEFRRTLRLDTTAPEKIAVGAGEVAQRLLAGESGVELAIANTVWIQSGLHLNGEFSDALQRGHGASLQRTDFQTAPERARLDINRAIEDATGGRIRDLLPPGTINEMSRLVLTNAVYLKAAWAVPFAEHATRPGVFHRSDGSTVTVPMMRAIERYGYARGDNFEAVRLPYAGDRLGMTILLPSGPLDALERQIQSAGLPSVLGEIHFAQIELTLPRFTVRTKRVLNPDLQALGLVTAFDPASADFSAITTDEQLVVGHIVHESFVNVDEKGTEAAAATAVGMRVVSMPVATARVVVNRPFLFAITEEATGLPLFLGRVLDPSGHQDAAN